MPVDMHELDHDLSYKACHLRSSVFRILQMFFEFSETETRLLRNKLDLRLHNFHVLCVHVHIQLKIRLIILEAFVSVDDVFYFGFI